MTVMKLPENLDLQKALYRLAETVCDGVLLIDVDSRQVHYCNPAAEGFARYLTPMGRPVICRELLDRVPAEAFRALADSSTWSGSLCIPGATSETELQVSIHSCAPHEATADGRPAIVVCSHTGNGHLLALELQRAYEKITATQESVLQSEKMAATGRLAAGIAHEINNPIGYVHSNLGTLKEYVTNLTGLLGDYDHILRRLPHAVADMADIDTLRARYDIEYVLQDIPQVLNESLDGITRVRRIVQDLKDFSHSARNNHWQAADLHRTLESTLNIVSSEIKYKGRLEKHYGELPPVECLVAEMSQVFMNMLVNASHAISESGTISIRTGTDNDQVWIEISDTGIGIPPENLAHLFDPFFTTKPVGQGTGLGLSIAWGIVAKHHGRIEVTSKPGTGSTFRVVLPVRQPVSHTQ